jgi:hypothetical protein
VPAPVQVKNTGTIIPKMRNTLTEFRKKIDRILLEFGQLILIEN